MMQNMTPEEFSKKFQDLRNQLLALHKDLLDFERKRYEGVYGRILSPNNYFSLVLNHPSFQWLRTLSELVVVFDEYIDNKKKEVTQKMKEDVLDYTKKLLSPNEDGSEFSQKYHLGIQNSPEAAVMHGKIMLSLKEFIVE